MCIVFASVFCTSTMFISWDLNLEVGDYTIFMVEVMLEISFII
jgi:hypothetical protein